MPDDLKTPFLSLINVFLISIFTPNGDSTRLKFNLTFSDELISPHRFGLGPSEKFF